MHELWPQNNFVLMQILQQVLSSIPSTSAETIEHDVEVEDTEDLQPACQSVAIQTVPYVRNARIQVSQKPVLRVSHWDYQLRNQALTPYVIFVGVQVGMNPTFRHASVQCDFHHYPVTSIHTTSIGVQCNLVSHQVTSSPVEEHYSDPALNQKCQMQVKALIPPWDRTNLLMRAVEYPDNKESIFRQFLCKN